MGFFFSGKSEKGIQVLAAFPDSRNLSIYQVPTRHDRLLTDNDILYFDFRGFL